MSQYPPSEIYTAARSLLPELAQETRQRIEKLLQQADRGEATHLIILETLSKDEGTRRKMREVLQKPGSEFLDDMESSRGYGGMPGAPQITPGEVWVCPEPQCEERYVIGEAGEDPGECQKHGVPLIRKNEKEG